MQLGKPLFTHDLHVLTTLMAEVCAIANPRPITSIPSEANDPQALIPNMLMTLKTKPSPRHVVRQDLYSRKRQQCVQYLANQFWVRWRRELLQNRQQRCRWHKATTNLKEGDVLLREKECSCKNWPLGRVVKIYYSKDD